MINIGELKKIDKTGRIVIPEGYRKFYKFKEDTDLCVIGTEDGALISNPKYKVVEITDTEDK